MKKSTPIKTQAEVKRVVRTASNFATVTIEVSAELAALIPVGRAIVTFEEAQKGLPFKDEEEE